MVHAFDLVHYKPNSRLGDQGITVGANNIKFVCILDKYKSVKYQQEGDNCNLVYDDAISTIQNSNFLYIFCEDLSEILLVQNVNMSNFKIILAKNYVCPDSISSQILDTIKTSLCLRSVKMDIERLELEIFGFEQVMDLLSYINPKRLNSLILKFPATDAQEDIGNILALDRWREYENLEFVLYWHTVSAKALIFIKEILITSRIFESIRIYFEQLDKEKVREIFGQIIGQRILDNEDWYLRIPNSKNQVLCTHVYKNCIEVSRKHDKKTYDSLPSTDEPSMPFEDYNDWSITLDNKTIIELLLDHLGFIEIQTLRKVCSNIRTCIDHFKPNPNLTKLGIDIHDTCDGKIDIKMGFKDGSYRKTPYATSVREGPFLTIRLDNYGCFIQEKLPPVECTVGDILLPDTDMFETCLDDLKTIVPRKNCYLEEFEFAVQCTRYGFCTRLVFTKKEEFLEKLEKLLNPNDVLMETRKFIYFENCVEPNQMPEPILWLEPISLELIEIHSYKRREENINDVMERIMNTNQWQYAKEYVMKGFAFLGKVNPIHFVHFSKIDITVRNWTNEDMFNWKEEILYSPSFLRYKISFENCSIDNDIYNLLGLPYRTVNGRTTWYFKMPEKNLVLHVIYYVSKSIIFTRVDIEDVPEFVVMNFGVQLID